MKHLFSLFLLTASVLMGSAQERPAFHDADAEIRSVGSFISIDVSNAIELELSQGNQEVVAVSVPGHKENIENVKTEVHNGVLKIWYDQKRWFRNGGKKVRAYVSFITLKRISASGACDVHINGELKGEELKVDLSGASDLKGAVEATSVFVDLSGASDVFMTGHAGNVNIKASGASRIRAYDFAADNCLVDASGASDIQITVNKILKAQASGATNIYYKGEGSVSEIKSSGASSIVKKS